MSNSKNLDWVKRPPRGLAHELVVGGCPGFHGGEHTRECNRLTQALIDYGRWREQKGRETGRREAIDAATSEAGLS